MTQSEPRRRPQTPGEMAVGVLHDVNQSLLIVTGFLELAEAALQDEDVATAQARIRLATRAAIQAAASSRGVLNSVHGAPSETASTIDVGQLLHEVAQLTYPQWGRAAQDQGRMFWLSVDAPPGLHIHGSPHALRAALINLILNAVDAMPSGGAIKLAARQFDDHITVAIADTGTGMSAETLAHCTDPFFSTKGSTGLGLPHVYATVQQHGGTIELQSAEHRGTCFRLHFPARPPRRGHRTAEPPQPTAAPARPSAAEHPAPVRQLHILVVEDSSTLRHLIGLILKRMGHVVQAVASGAEALATLERATYDLILSDLSLGLSPSGLELARQAKRRAPDVRFILATGSLHDLPQAEYARRGVDLVLHKPFTPTQLRDALHLVAPLAPL